jgi:hypothetical protein
MMLGMNRKCPLCGEIVGYHDSIGTPLLDLATGEWDYPHRECGLRSVIGGIGHLIDHQLWCVERGDPDGGLTYRLSAQAVRSWVEEFGVEAAAGRGSDGGDGS